MAGGKGVLPVGDFVHCREQRRKARDVFVEVETPWSEAVGGVGAGTLSTKEGAICFSWGEAAKRR